MRATHIEFYDVGTNGATECITIPGQTTVRSVNVSSSINIDKPLPMYKGALGGIISITAFGDITGGSSTALVGNISAKSGHIQTKT